MRASGIGLSGIGLSSIGLAVGLRFMRELTAGDFGFLIFAVRWTVLLAFISFSGGVVIGALVAAAGTATGRPLRAAAAVYVAVFQGTPLLMQLFLFFFGLSLAGVQVPAIVAAGIALTCNTGAYLAEIWRGCLNAIPKGQWDSSAALAMTRFEQLIYVIVPQAVRIAIPPTVGYSVHIIKNTSLASIIGFVELSRTAQLLNNATFSPLPIFGAVAAIYFVMCFSLSAFGKAMERKLAV